MIKVMQVLTDTNIGGAGIWLLNYLKSRNLQKYEITVVLPEGAKLIPKAEEQGVKIIEAKSIADCSFSKAGVAELMRIIKSEKPHIVHSHASFDARIAAKLCGVKAVHTRHCLEPAKTGIKRMIYSYVNNYLSSKVIGVSNAVVQNLSADGIKKSKLNMIYNGISPVEIYTPADKLSLREKYGFTPDDVVIGLVARLEPVKNPLLFAEAAKLTSKVCPQAAFILAGDGSLRKEVSQAVKPLGSRMLLTGFMDNVADAYNAMDIITLTSDSEALSISLIEGQSTGMAAISTDCGGPREIISDGVNGYIVPVGDARALADAMIKLIQNPSTREEFGLKGKMKAQTDFAIESMARKTEAIYDELADK